MVSVSNGSTDQRRLVVSMCLIPFQVFRSIYYNEPLLWYTVSAHQSPLQQTDLAFRQTMIHYVL